MAVKPLQRLHASLVKARCRLWANQDPIRRLSGAMCPVNLIDTGQLPNHIHLAGRTRVRPPFSVKPAWSGQDLKRLQLRPHTPAGLICAMPSNSELNYGLGKNLAKDRGMLKLIRR